MSNQGPPANAGKNRQKRRSPFYQASEYQQTPGMHRRDRSPFDFIPHAATCASPRAEICRRLWRIQADEGPIRHRAQGSALVLTTGRQCRIARFNRRLLPLSIPDRKLSVPGRICPGTPFYKELMFPWKGCLQAFHGRASILSMLCGPESHSISGPFHIDSGKYVIPSAAGRAHLAWRCSPGSGPGP